MEIFNFLTGETDDHSTEKTPDGFRCSAVSIGKRIGASHMGMTVYESPPGQAICPSDKVGVWAGDKHYMLRRVDHLDDWDGET